MIPEGMSILASALRDVRRLKDKYTYYIPFLDNMRIVIDNNVPTMAMTKTFVCLINEKFYSELGIDERSSVIMHELLHYYLCHHSRQQSLTKNSDGFTKELSHQFHNICMDMEINSLIDLNIDGGVHPSKYGLPEKLGYERYLSELLNILHNEVAYVKYHYNFSDEEPSVPLSDYLDRFSHFPMYKELIEEIRGVNYRSGNSVKYNIDKAIDLSNEHITGLRMAMLKSLLPSSGSGNGKGECEGGSICKSDNLPNDVDHRNDQDIDDQSQKKVVEQLKADGIGKMSESNSIKQQIQTVKYEWDKLFKSIVASVASSIRYGYEYRTFSKPNKRLTDVCCTTDILYPTSYEDNYVVNLVVGIDVSGSMGDSVELMYSMIKSIIDFIPESNLNITILECDTEVTKRIDNFVINQSLIDVGHGGGTDMDAIIRYTQSNKLPYDAIIIMTDGETAWHDTDDNYLKSKVHVIVDSDYANEDYKCPYKCHRASFSELKSKKAN